MGEPVHLASLDELLPTPEGLMALDTARSRLAPERELTNTRLRARMRHALRALPRPFRLVVFLREMEGLSTREVAEILQISEVNVKTRLHRARLFLRQRLEEGK